MGRYDERDLAQSLTELPWHVTDPAGSVIMVTDPLMSPTCIVKSHIGHPYPLVLTVLTALYWVLSLLYYTASIAASVPSADAGLTTSLAEVYRKTGGKLITGFLLAYIYHVSRLMM